MPTALSNQPHAYIYVIGYRGPLVKVGFSLWPEKRRAQLQARYKTPLHLLYDCRVPRSHAAGVERLVHSRLQDSRKDGEWFLLSAKEAIGAIVAAALDYEMGVRLLRPGKKPTIQLNATETLLQRVEEWRASQRPIPNKSEAARMLIEIGLNEAELKRRERKPKTGAGE